MKSLIKSIYDPAVVGLILISALFAFAGTASAATAVDLGAGSNFVVLSHAGITDVPTSIITGNIGTDGVASSMGITCGEVTGLIYTISAGGPLCETIDASLLNTAMTNIGTAYTTANGEATSGSGLNPGAGGEIGSLVLAPGVYTFTGGNINVLISTDLTLNGNPTDVWIFQIPGTFDVATNIKVNLTGGAVPANVFWVVGDQTTLHVGSTLEGTILGYAGVAMQNLATLHGRAFSSTASITLSANTISATAPITLNSISITTPANKLSYDVGNVLDITGLVVTGTYSDNSTAPIIITNSNISGFDSSSGVDGQIVTITFEGKTTTFAVDIVVSAGTQGGHRRNINSATPSLPSQASPVAIGHVLGAFTGPNFDSPQVIAIKDQIVNLIAQLVGLLREQLATAIAAGQH